jgi:hypothetical protein
LKQPVLAHDHADPIGAEPRPSDGGATRAPLAARFCRLPGRMNTLSSRIGNVATLAVGLERAGALQ